MRPILYGLICSTLLASCSDTGPSGLAPADTGPKRTGARKIGGKEGKWGFIDTEGHYVINPQFDGAGLFSEGLARVKIDSKGGFIDAKGTIVINPQFDDVKSFSEGFGARKNRR